MRKPKSQVNAALRTSHLDWLTKLESETSDSASQIARNSGLDPSTLTRFKKPTSTRVLDTLTISQITNAYKVDPPTDPNGAPAKGFQDEATPYRSSSSGSEIDIAIRALTAGRNNCDPWTLRTRTLEAAGYLPGDVVLVDLSAQPRDGDAVLAQVYDFERMKAVSVWRKYRQSGDLALLVPASFDPSLGEPLLVNGKDVSVKGVLLPHRLRPVNKAA